MKKNIFIMVTIIGLLIGAISVLTACSQAERASYNISKEADNFNIVRQLTVINCIKGDVLFQMTGRLSITVDSDENQLEIIVEEDNDKYVKHFIGLSDNVTYTIEDLNLGKNEVNNYKYSLNFNPKMWIPVEGKVID